MRLGRRAPSTPTAHRAPRCPCARRRWCRSRSRWRSSWRSRRSGPRSSRARRSTASCAAQAETARHLVTGELDAIAAAADAPRSPSWATTPARGTGRALEEQLMAFSRRERLTLAAAVDEGGGAGRRRAAGVDAAPVRARAARAGARRTGGRPPGPGRSRQDEPFVLAVDVDARRAARSSSGASIDRELLAEVERADRRARAPRDHRRRARCRRRTAPRVRVAAELADGSRSRVQVASPPTPAGTRRSPACCSWAAPAC